MTVRIELTQGNPLRQNDKAVAVITVDGNRVAKIEAEVVSEPGADAGRYPTVRLTTIEAGARTRPHAQPFGSRPASEQAWTNGKTAGSLEFVRNAVRALGNPAFDARDQEMLRTAIRMVKAGSMVFDASVSPEEYLGRDGSPT